MICPNCKTENVDGAAFCDNCGKPLSAAPATPAPPAPPPAQVVAPPPPPPAAVPAAPAPAGPALSKAEGPALSGAEGKVKCQVCGNDNDATNVFCENCGASLTKPAVVPPPSVAAPVAPPLPVAPPTPPPVAPPAAPAPAVVAPPPAPSVQPAAPPPQPTAPVTPPPQPVAPPVTPAPAPAQPQMIAATPATQPPPPGHPRFVVAASGMYFDISNRVELMIGRVDPISGIFPEIDLTAHGGDEGGVSRKHCRITLAGNQYFAEDLGSSNGTWIKTTRLQPNVRAALNNGAQLRLGKLVLNFFTGQ